MKTLSIIAALIITTFTVTAKNNQATTGQSTQATTITFDATVTGSMVICKWNEQEDVTNNYFELQRSFDGKNFVTVALIFSSTLEESVKNEGIFKDNACILKKKKVVYYRMKQIDTNGNLSYSPVINVKLK